MTSVSGTHLWFQLTFNEQKYLLEILQKLPEMLGNNRVIYYKVVLFGTIYIQSKRISEVKQEDDMDDEQVGICKEQM